MVYKSKTFLFYRNEWWCCSSGSYEEVWSWQPWAHTLSTDSFLGTSRCGAFHYGNRTNSSNKASREFHFECWYLSFVAKTSLGAHTQLVNALFWPPSNLCSDLSHSTMLRRLDFVFICIPKRFHLHVWAFPLALNSLIHLVFAVLY